MLRTIFSLLLICALSLPVVAGAAATRTSVSAGYTSSGYLVIHGSARTSVNVSARRIVVGPTSSMAHLIRSGKLSFYTKLEYRCGSGLVRSLSTKTSEQQVQLNEFAEFVSPSIIANCNQGVIRIVNLHAVAKIDGEKATADLI